MQPMRLCILSDKNSKYTFENTHRKKSRKFNQCDYKSSPSRFDETFENTLRRKVKQMQLMQLCILSDKNSKYTFENTHWKKSRKYNQCNYKSLPADVLMKHLKTLSGEKSNKCYQCDLLVLTTWEHSGDEPNKYNLNATMHPLRQEIWGHIEKGIAEKSHTNAIDVNLNFYVETFWGNIWKHRAEKIKQM